MGRKERLTEYWRRLRGMVMGNELSKCEFVPEGDPRLALCKGVERQKGVREISARDTGKRMTDIPAPDLPDDRYYEDLINGLIPACTGLNKMIQALTKKDAGVVLAMIGMGHPAARVVYGYLVQQKCDQYGSRGGYLLLRKRIMKDLPPEKSHRRVSDPRDPAPAPGSAF